MANLIDTASAWEAGVYQLEITDPVVGGPPNPDTFAGMDNIPHLQLARRTQWLRAQVESLQSGAGYRGASIISAGQTLTAADMGRCLVFNGGSAVTLILPAISAVPDGAAIEVINTGIANVTIARAGSDQIDTGPSTATTLVVPPGQSAKLLRATGSANWHPVSITASALNTAFGASIGFTGWQRWPTGLILQWGVSSGAAGNRLANFPITFPTALFGVFHSGAATSGAISDFNNQWLLNTSSNQTGAVFYAANNQTINWFALGN